MKNLKNKSLIIIILINLIIFCFTNLIFDIKYEQVDDFIIYNLYSGLDGTYNFHGVYLHPIICIVLSLIFRINSSINWHSIFLLSMQFVCFTIIGYILLEKHKNKLAIALYSIFASICYTSLLLLIQYTSVAALLILTSFFMLWHGTTEKKNKKYKCIAIVLYAIGIMIRMQSLMIILPFFILLAIVQFKKKNILREEISTLAKNYLILFLVTCIVYISNMIIYKSNDVYREYIEYNNIRATLHDLSYTDYEENKEIFNEIGWSENDHYLFYTFNFGDENVYNKENLQKIVDYKKNKNEYYNLNLDFERVCKYFLEEAVYINTYISILFVSMFILAMINNKEKSKINILIFITTILIHILFIVLNRSMQRVVIPEYIIGIVLFIYNLNLKYQNDTNNTYDTIIIFSIIISIVFSGSQYQYNYKLKDYKMYQAVIDYTNEHKENVYLYTVPSLQYRYLTYSVYKMPPKGSFSNLRVMGGWDMFTQNYYDFKERYELEGTFLDVLKENVYIIDGDVTWSGNYYTNYIEHIVVFLEENYNTEVSYEKIKEFDNIYIYKITNINEKKEE